MRSYATWLAGVPPMDEEGGHLNPDDLLRDDLKCIYVFSAISTKYLLLELLTSVLPTRAAPNPT